MFKNVKNITILGSTGSIGQNSLDVISKFLDRFRPIYLSANKGIDLLIQQIKLFNPKGVSVMDNESVKLLRQIFGNSLEIYLGIDGLNEISSKPEVDIVINSIVGFAGLEPTIEAIKAGKTIALANKETLVGGGQIISKLIETHNSNLVPIDSEHNAILQCLTGEEYTTISKLILTASGGPFLNLDVNEFENITIDKALNHPNWRMGNKITIDSATLMNKGLEVIEAHYLFKLPSDKIEVIIHPQSIIHSMVEFIDGSVKAQLGMPDMRIPIQYALTYPERWQMSTERINFTELGQLTFLKPDYKKFKCLELAYRALNIGGVAPVVLNAANEIAVEYFLNGKIKFPQIPELIESALENLPLTQTQSIKKIIEINNDTRLYIKKCIERL